MTNSTTRKRAKIFHLTRQTGHQLRIEMKKVKMSKMKELRAITMKMETESKGKASMKKAKNRTVMEKKLKREKKSKNSTRKVKHKNKIMVVKKGSKNKTMAMRVRMQSMVTNSTDDVPNGLFNK